MKQFWAGAGMAIVIALTADGGARADTPPSVWDIAKDPAIRSTYELHVRVDRLLHPSSDGSDGAELGLGIVRMRELRLEAAKATLEAGIRDAGDGPELLRVDLALVLEALASIQQRGQWHRQVADLLAPLANRPEGFGGDLAPLEALATAYAWLDRPREEVPIWRRYVDDMTDDRRRVSPLVNLGEAEMRLGDLTGATAEFRRAIEICEGLAGAASLDAEYALALWDLSVALDRAGDSSVALDTVRRAKRWTWLEEGPLGLVRTVTGWDVIHDQVDVYFVPAWEREWYLAMGEAADADSAPDAAARARMWATAEEHWKAYVAGAEAQLADTRVSDRATHWVATARLRLAHAHAKRVQAGP